MIPLRDLNPTRRTAFLTLLTIAVCIGVYVLVQLPAGNRGEEVRFTYRYAAIPCEVIQGDPLSEEEVVRTIESGDDAACIADDRTDEVFPGKGVLLALLTSMFLHGNLLHLGGNMLFLWVFGNNIEDRLGHVGFAVFYLVAGLAASAAHIAIQPSSTIPVVGASGAIAGVMGAYLVWFPRAKITTAITLFLIFFARIEARWLLGFWFLSQFFLNRSGGVAWMAHVGGFVFGVVAGLLLRPAIRRPEDVAYGAAPQPWDPRRPDPPRGWQ